MECINLILLGAGYVLKKRLICMSCVYCSRACCDSLHVTQDTSMHAVPSSSSILIPSAMIGENRQFVTNEPVEFEK